MQEKSDLAGLIKWKFQKVTFFFAHPLLLKQVGAEQSQAQPSLRYWSELNLTNVFLKYNMLIG